MTSIKKSIVDKIISRIPAGTGLTPEESFKNPFREISEDELPCLKVALMRGRSEEIDTRIRYRHNDSLIVAWVDQGNGDELVDRLYEAGEKIADFLINDANNSGEPEALYHEEIQLMLANWDMDLKTGAAGTGAIVLTFDIKYHTEHTLVFEDLESIHLNTKPKEASDDDNTASFIDTIDLPTD